MARRFSDPAPLGPGADRHPRTTPSPPPYPDRYPEMQDRARASRLPVQRNRRNFMLGVRAINHAVRSLMKPDKIRNIDISATGEGRPRKSTNLLAPESPAAFPGFCLAKMEPGTDTGNSLKDIGEKVFPDTRKPDWNFPKQTSGALSFAKNSLARAAAPRGSPPRPRASAFVRGVRKNTPLITANEMRPDESGVGDNPGAFPPQHNFFQ